MAYNPVARGGATGGPAAAGGGAGSDQFSMANISPEDYLGTSNLYLTYH